MDLLTTILMIVMGSRLTIPLIALLSMLLTLPLLLFKKNRIVEWYLILSGVLFNALMLSMAVLTLLLWLECHNARCFG